MKLELVTTAGAFEVLRGEWDRLLTQNATNEIFLTWEWQNTWWLSYHPGDLWIVTAHDESGTLIGVAPWFIEQPSRTVRTIGCVEVTDYLDVLVAPDHYETFFSTLADFLVVNRAAYSKIDLCNIPTGAPILEIMPRYLTERGFFVNIAQQEVCPIIDLPDDFETYLNSLDKKQRHELRRKLRRVEDDHEEAVEWYCVGPERDIAVEIEKFIDLMAASHPDKANFLQDEKNMTFFRAVMPRLAACGWLQLSFLTVDGTPAAAYLNFDYNNRILVYNSGLLPQTYAYLSPGIVLLAYNIDYAIQQCKEVFDFLRGNEDYKYRMGAQDRPVMMLEAAIS